MLDNRHFIARRCAQYFKDGDVVNLGIGIPGLSADYAPEGVLFQTENGLIGVGRTATMLEKSDCLQNVSSVNFVPVPGACAFDVQMSFEIIRSGRMAAAVLGALQVAENGDIANWATPGRAFGMGGAMDLCCGAKKVIAAMELCAPDGSKKILHKCTYPLTAVKAVSSIVTEQCVIDVTDKGLVLVEIRQGKTPEDIQAQVEPKLIISPDLKVMEE